MANSKTGDVSTSSDDVNAYAPDDATVSRDDDTTDAALARSRRHAADTTRDPNKENVRSLDNEAVKNSTPPQQKEDAQLKELSTTQPLTAAATTDQHRDAPHVPTKQPTNSMESTAGERTGSELRNNQDLKHPSNQKYPSDSEHLSEGNRNEPDSSDLNHPSDPSSPPSQPDSQISSSPSNGWQNEPAASPEGGDSDIMKNIEVTVIDGSKAASSAGGGDGGNMDPEKGIYVSDIPLVDKQVLKKTESQPTSPTTNG